ncbi:MAG: SRPBCC family protein [Asticcacaulis sp.]
MSELADPTSDAYGALIEPATLRLERLLPGPIERVWDYLTQSDLRRQWLASGDMKPEAGTSFELTWRNGELGGDPGQRPEGMSAEHSMQSHIIAYDPPYRLAFAWGERGEVDIALVEEGGNVRLTLVHQRISDRRNMVMVGAGWHAHLDVLADRLNGRASGPFWEHWTQLKAEYERRLPN